MSAPNDIPTALDPHLSIAEPDNTDREIVDEVHARLFGPVSLDSTDGTGTEPGNSSGRRPWRGTLVGRYVVLDKLGAGGMGIVFAAYDPELDRKVALKLLLPNSSTESGRVRLIHEAKALAKLTHPNVVAVYDVGTHGDQVWIAMEFVLGQTLGAWVKQRQPGWPELLRVLTDIVRGVAAAHAVGLVHRDLKPENVMIGRDGRVRVMDFGLARSQTLATAEQEFAARSTTVAPDRPDQVFIETLHPDLGLLAARLTEAGAIQGSPAYMAPEQWRGEQATVAADQFGWSVMAWEAVYGERPFAGKDLMTLAANVLLGSRKPLRKSRGVPSWLRRLLERGLSTEASQRWPTMTKLLAELERGRTLARVRMAVAAVAAVVALCAGWVGYQRLDINHRVDACTAEGESIEAVWNEDARTKLRDGLLATRVPYAAITVERVIPFFDAQADAWKAARTEACLDARVRAKWDEDTLDRAMWCLDERRMEMEALVTELSHADAASAESAVTSAAGLSQVDTCRDPDRLGRLPPLPNDRESIRRILEMLSEAGALRSAGKNERALEVAREAVTAAEALGWPPLAAATHWHVGDVLIASGKFSEGEQSLERAYFQALEFGATEVAVEASVSLIRAVGYLQARYDEGLRWSKHAAAMLSILGTGEDSFARHIYLNNLAALYSFMRKTEEAKALHEQALSTLERTLGPHHPSIAIALNNFAMLHINMGTFDEAKTLLERSVAIAGETVGPDHPSYGESLDNLAHAHLKLGEYEKAKELHQRARDNLEKALGPDHINVAHSLHKLALVYTATGARSEAEALNRRALTIFEKTLGSDHPDVAQSLNNLGLDINSAGRHEEAKALIQRALAIWEKTLGPNHPTLAGPLHNLALAHFSLGAYDDAKALNERGLAILEKELGPDDPTVAYCLTSLANIALAQRRPADAVRLAERAVRLREVAGSSASLLAESWYMLARGLWDAPSGQGRDRDRALAVARQARDGFLAAGGRDEKLARIESFLAKNGDSTRRRRDPDPPAHRARP